MRLRKAPAACGILQESTRGSVESGLAYKSPGCAVVKRSVSQSVLPSNTSYFRLRRAHSPPLTELASKSSQLAAAHSPYVGTSIRDIFIQKDFFGNRSFHHWVVIRW